MYLSVEIQGYIRHILHMIGMIIVARGGVSQSMLDIYVGGAVNLISLAWFIFTVYKDKKKLKKFMDGEDSVTEEPVYQTPLDAQIGEGDPPQEG